MNQTRLPLNHLDNIKLIATDIDGTLMDDSKRLPSDFYDTLARLNDSGISFAIASGRQLESLKIEFKDIADKIYLIAENGALISHNNSILHTDCISKTDALFFIDCVRNIKGAKLILCGINYSYVEDEDEDFLNETRIYYKALKKVDNLKEIAMSEPVCKFAVYHKEGAEDTIYKELLNHSEKYQVNLSGKLWVDCMKSNVNKGTAMKFLFSNMNITADNSVAFGDYLNDYEMLMTCTNSFAMANGHDKLLKECKYIAPSNNERGVTYCINNFIL